MIIQKLIPSYISELKILNRSPYTIRTTKYNLRDMVRFFESEQTHTIEQLTVEALAEYQQDLAFRLTVKGKILSLRSQEKRLCCAKGFTRFLYEKDYLPADPGAKIKLPKQPKKLPKVILTEKDIQKMFAAAGLQSNRGYRNRIILEILYDTGIRRLELTNIKTNDLDLKTGYIHIQGKGNKERVVPVSKRVCDLIQDYLLIVRPTFVQGKDHGWLILNRWGEKMNPNGVWAVVKRCAHLAGIKKNVSTHSFRHNADSRIMPIVHVKSGAVLAPLQLKSA